MGKYFHFLFYDGRIKNKKFVRNIYVNNNKIYHNKNYSICLQNTYRSTYI